MKRCSMKAEELDRLFDEGEDITPYLDLSKGARPNLVPKRVSMSMPTWMVDALDKEAARLGVQRQAVVKLWLAQRLEQRRVSSQEHG